MLEIMLAIIQLHFYKSKYHVRSHYSSIIHQKFSFAHSRRAKVINSDDRISGTLTCCFFFFFLSEHIAIVAKCLKCSVPTGCVWSLSRLRFAIKLVQGIEFSFRDLNTYIYIKKKRYSKIGKKINKCVYKIL